MERLDKNAPREIPVNNQPGENNRRDPLLPDWKDNWVSSIAIKITAPLLWFLVFIGTAVSFLLSGDVSTNIQMKLNDRADRYAYVFSRSISSGPASFNAIGANLFGPESKGEPFNAIEIHASGKSWSFGKAARNDEVMSRPLLGPAAGKSSTGTIKFFHVPVRELVKRERARLLVSAALPLVLLGIALSLLINKIVVDPIRNLVQATRRITDGDIELRLNSEREDEFGHLERFFDRMLDQLQEQKDQLQHALESAREADRIKSQFLANMSHELRTPLNAIIGYSELTIEALADDRKGSQKYLGDLERIRSSGLHLLTLINDVLDIAKIEAGKMQIARSQFDIRKMLDEVAVTAKPLMRSNNNQFRFDCPENIGSMKSDELRIRQILINLLSNAAKFTREGKVELSVERYTDGGADWIRFKVSDTGIGISDADSDRLFNEFAQVEDHIRGKPAGTGLGLAISQKFCNLMGGKIRLESTPGTGSTFIVELPAVIPD
ncbi:MAG: sensor histidine kinase [Acidiferrobacterales bacterium]